MDPICPFLFILCCEVLTRLLCRAGSQNLLRESSYLEEPRLPLISCLADDLFISLFLVGLKLLMLMLYIRDCLHRYTIWSGQKVNTQKSAAFFSKNTVPPLSAAISQLLQIRKTDIGGKHLRLPLLIPRSRKLAYLRLKYSARSRSSTKNQVLSFCSIILNFIQRLKGRKHINVRIETPKPSLIFTLCLLSQQSSFGVPLRSS